MGELFGGGGADNVHQAPNISFGGERKGTAPDGKYNTDVEDVWADDAVCQGKDQFPCFDVSKEEFFQNMENGRRRLRFKGGTAAQKYMSGTKYNRPFYVRHTDENGKQYVRKIK